MKILFVSLFPPYPTINGYSLRIFNLMRTFSEKHEVFLFSYHARDDRNETALAGLAPICKDVHLEELPPYKGLAKPLEFFIYLLRGIPPELRLYHSPQSIRSFTRYLEDNNFDLVQFEGSYLAIYAYLIPGLKKMKKTVEFIDIVAEKMNRAYRVERKFLRKIRLWLYSRTMRGWEIRTAADFDLCITMSETDRRLLLAKDGKLKTAVVPNGVDTEENAFLPPPDGGEDLIFIGTMSYLPNVDAAVYFVEEILPLIKEKKPGVRLWIVGNNPAERVKALARDDIIVTGRVDSVVPYYARSRVCVVPLRAGGGTRLKILEAMALGRPVVSTSIGCEGIEAEDGDTICIADDAVLFAEKVLALLDDETSAQTMARRARELAVNVYDWNVIAGKALQDLEKI